MCMMNQLLDLRCVADWLVRLYLMVGLVLAVVDCRPVLTDPKSTHSA